MIKLFYSKTFKNYICMMLTLFAVEIIFRLVSGFAILDFSLLRIFVGINIYNYSNFLLIFQRYLNMLNVGIVRYF